jgi:hypothetical protein
MRRQRAELRAPPRSKSSALPPFARPFGSCGPSIPDMVSNRTLSSYVTLYAVRFAKFCQGTGMPGPRSRRDAGGGGLSRRNGTPCRSDIVLTRCTLNQVIASTAGANPLSTSRDARHVVSPTLGRSRPTWADTGLGVRNRCLFATIVGCASCNTGVGFAPIAVLRAMSCDPISSARAGCPRVHGRPWRRNLGH